MEVMTTTQAHQADLLALLLEDHAEAKRLLQAFDTVADERRHEAFRHIVKVLMAHESAEELVVYPALRDCAAGGAAIARDRMAEQEQAERLLADLERQDLDDPAFAGWFRQLRASVLEHAEMEERTVFWVLSNNLDRRTLERLAERYQATKSRAPTHAHPLAPHSAPADRVTGRLAGLLDRLRDKAHLRDAPRLRQALHQREVTPLLRARRSVDG